MRRPRSGWRRLALAALAAAALTPPGRAQDPRALTYLLSSDVDSLDPDWAYDATSLFAISQIYETLVDFDGTATDRFVPRLASVVPNRENGFLSQDRLTYAFPLRGDVKFHDGSLMTAEDVRYSLLRFALMDRDDGPSPLLLEPLTGRRSTRGSDGKPDPAVFDAADKAVTLEGGALVLQLKKPFAPLLSVLAGSGHIVSKTYVAAHGGWDGTKESWLKRWNPPKAKAELYDREDGTGPFALGVWDRAAKTLVLTRNDAYWRSPASLPSARLETVEDPRERRRRLERGDADAAQVDPRGLSYFEKTQGVVIDQVPNVEVQNVIFFNFKIAPDDNPWLGSGGLDGAGIPPDFFADLDVRKGFAYSFDDDAYIRLGFQGRGERAHGPIPKGLIGYDPRQTGWTYSLEEAAKALKRARGGRIWANGFLLPMAYTEGRDDRRLACQILQQGLAKVDPKFRVECRGIPQSRLLDELRAHRLSAFCFRWILDYPDPHNAVEPFLSSTGFFAQALGYSNPRADALIEQAEAEPDLRQRRALYAELQALAIYDAPQIYTVDAPGSLARRQNVQNWTYPPMQPFGNLYEVTKLFP